MGAVDWFLSCDCDAVSRLLTNFLEDGVFLSLVIDKALLFTVFLIFHHTHPPLFFPHVFCLRLVSASAPRSVVNTRLAP
jgi:hypothetical protein